MKIYQTDLMNANTIEYLYELIGLNFNFKQDEITQVEGYSVWENKALTNQRSNRDKVNGDQG